MQVQVPRGGAGWCGFGVPPAALVISESDQIQRFRRPALDAAIVSLLHVEELDVEDERGVRRDRSLASRPVGQ